jgi:hypothetical protein
MAIESKANTWVTFIGVVLLLIGIYATVRTAVNLVAFEKYPSTGVLTLNFSGMPAYMQREQDCFYPMTYTTPNGAPRAATADEKENEKKQQEICLSGVADARENAKVNDISQALLFLVLGAGVLISRRIFFK